MTDEQINNWAAHPDHHYPQMVLSTQPRRVLPAGKTNLDAFLLYANPEERALLVERIEQWNERAGEQSVEQGKEIA